MSSFTGIKICHKAYATLKRSQDSLAQQVSPSNPRAVITTCEKSGWAATLTQNNPEDVATLNATKRAFGAAENQLVERLRARGHAMKTHQDLIDGEAWAIRERAALAKPNASDATALEHYSKLNDHYTIWIATARAQINEHTALRDAQQDKFVTQGHLEALHGLAQGASEVLMHRRDMAAFGRGVQEFTGLAHQQGLETVPEFPRQHAEYEAVLQETYAEILDEKEFKELRIEGAQALKDLDSDDNLIEPVRQVIQKMDAMAGTQGEICGIRAEGRELYTRMHVAQALHGLDQVEHVASQDEKYAQEQQKISTTLKDLQATAPANAAGSSCRQIITEFLTMTMPVHALGRRLRMAEADKIANAAEIEQVGSEALHLLQSKIFKSASSKNRAFLALNLLQSTASRYEVQSLLLKKST